MRAAGSHGARMATSPLGGIVLVRHGNASFHPRGSEDNELCTRAYPSFPRQILSSSRALSNACDGARRVVGVVTSFRLPFQVSSSKGLRWIAQHCAVSALYALSTYSPPFTIG